MRGKNMCFGNCLIGGHCMFDTHLMGCTLPKNVMESLLGTLMQSKDKGKDSLQCHMDLEAMGVRAELHPLTLPDDKNKVPVASWSLETK